ncbi:hypothetical protein E2C01_069893 [Portunus trituberculatus]|uniref:Uncharacterized protein n=1 Tax=Portunus trituberculatus TaxID=210409 RepID=A0A5B7HVS0_PORTR|nr:hypothetical protein [Portunus trituberculatus]
MKGPSGQHGEAGRDDGPEEGRERDSSGEVGRDFVGDLSSFTEMQFPTFSLGGDLLRFGDTFPGEVSLEGEAALERERRPQSHQAPPSPRPSFVAGEIFPERRQFQERARRWRPVVSIPSLTTDTHPHARTPTHIIQCAPPPSLQIHAHLGHVAPWFFAGEKRLFLEHCCSPVTKRPWY